MYNFQYYAPTKVVFGRDTVSQTAALIREYGGSSVLIHYGGKSAVRSGLIDQVKKILDDAGIVHVELGGVVPNPHLSKVREGIALAQAHSVDFILAVGGGSVVDSSKAIAYGLAEPDKDVWELHARKRQAKGCMSLGVILTIAAAGSEMSDSCVITNEQTKEKRGYSSNLARAKFAVMDPTLTMTLPDYQTQSGCTDIMMHTMERYFTQGGNMELTDVIAEGLVRTVMKNALILHTDPDNYDARAEVMWASSLSHNGLTGCGANGKDFASHALEHEMGGMFDVTHGAGLAAIWGSWARYVYKNNLDRFVKFAVKVMDVDPASCDSDEEIALSGIGKMEAFFHSIGMPINMHELGIDPTSDQIKEMAASCARAKGGKVGTAMELHEEDMIEVYRMARY